MKVLSSTILLCGRASAARWEIFPVILKPPLFWSADYQIHQSALYLICVSPLLEKLLLHAHVLTMLSRRGIFHLPGHHRLVN